MNTLIAKKLQSNLWSLDDGEVRCFLVVGTDRALLIDTGFGKINMAEEVRKLTHLPVTVLNSHAHGDHILGNGVFDEIYANPVGWERINHPNLKPLREGDLFYLGGGSVISVIELPGHTPDSLAFIDYAGRYMLTTDLLGPEGTTARDLDSFIRSVRRVIGLRPAIDHLYPSHGSEELKFEMCGDILACAEKIKAGELEGERIHVVLPPDVDIHTYVYKYRDVNISYNPELGLWD